MLNKPEFREVPHEKGYPDSQQRIERDEAIDFNEGLKAGLAYYEQELARAEGLSRETAMEIISKFSRQLANVWKCDQNYVPLVVLGLIEKTADAIIAAKRGEK